MSNALKAFGVPDSSRSYNRSEYFKQQNCRMSISIRCKQSQRRSQVAALKVPEQFELRWRCKGEILMVFRSLIVCGLRQELLFFIFRPRSLGVK